MKKLLFTIILTASVVAVKAQTMWYDRPADYWEEALPLGNGRLGAMVYGRVDTDTIQLNEDTFWSGSPYNNCNPKVLQSLPQIRQYINDGDYVNAQKLAMRTITADKRVTGHGMVYESVGNLLLRFPESHSKARNYRRTLDIGRALCTVQYDVDGVTYKREVFTSFADDVTIIRMTASKPGRMKFEMDFCGPLKSQRIVCDVKRENNGMHIVSRPAREAEENVKNGLQCHTLIRSVNDGTTATIIISSATNFVSYNDISGDGEKKARSIMERYQKAYTAALADHTAKYQQMFNRVKLNLGSNATQEAKPADQRIAEFSTNDDPGLVATYFQYGRYLLISSSYPGTQPANLQGIWNPDAHQYPAWDSKYTTNINVEMNYWPSEVTNLTECHEPFLKLIREVSMTGRESAQKMYGCRGWTLHHNTDIWRSTGAVDYASCSVWPTCNAWFCQHLWEHYLYTGDKTFLAEVYPVMKGASQFYQDFLVRDPKTGYLVVSPSNSPENHPGRWSYEDDDNELGSLGKKRSCAIFSGLAMDNEMVASLLSNSAEAARMMGGDEEKAFADSLDALRRQLPPMMIGKYGQLQEWLEDWDRETSSHRHISHLWALYPGNMITADNTPELFAAARKSLIGRGDASRGWSMGWKVCLWARLLDGNHAYKLIQNQLKLKPPTATIKDQDGGTYANGFDAHPPFQIDGNFGCTAGIAEMLVQSHGGYIHLLPALPDAWQEGSVSGLKMRGGFELVEMQWKAGKLQKAVIRSSIGGLLKVKTARGMQQMDTAAGQTYVITE